MADIVKICSNHGNLTSDQVYIEDLPYRKRIRCKQCKKAEYKKSYLKNLDKNKDKNRRRLKEYRLKNIEKMREYYRKYNSLNKEKHRKWTIKSVYNISDQDYQQMIKEQNNLCKICKKPETAKISKTKNIKNLAIDHCHLTNKIRGLLCSLCNSALGKFKDSIELLEEAIKYLKENKD